MIIMVMTVLKENVLMIVAVMDSVTFRLEVVYVKNFGLISQIVQVNHALMIAPVKASANQEHVFANKDLLDRTAQKRVVFTIVMETVYAKMVNANAMLSILVNTVNSNFVLIVVHIMVLVNLMELVNVIMDFLVKIVPNNLVDLSMIKNVMDMVNALIYNVYVTNFGVESYVLN